MTFVRAIVPITGENFDPEAYLLANPDVAAANLDPRQHFARHGRHERRQQSNLNFLEDSAEFRRKKFSRFRPLLKLDTEQVSFPVTAGDRHFSRSDYKVESANAEFGPFIDQIVAHPERNYLDLGCGLRPTVYDNCLYVEVYPSLTADLIVAPDCLYPIKDEAFDGIGCFAVLEHTRKPWIVVNELHRMLKPGGTVWIDWPFLQPVHGYPLHYFNATQEGLRSLFEDAGFKTQSLETAAYQGLDYTFTWLLDELLNSLPATTKKRIGRMTLNDLRSIKPGSQFWLDLFSEIDDLTKKKLACGNTPVATKG
jgi:SAM-dependent methyltransferase